MYYNGFHQSAKPLQWQFSSLKNRVDISHYLQKYSCNQNFPPEIAIIVRDCNDSIAIAALRNYEIFFSITLLSTYVKLEARIGII